MAYQHVPSLMETNATIRYTGPALDAGRMDVYQASANMIAFSEFMIAAVKTSYGDSAQAKAEVEGFAHGSFITNLIISVAGSATSVFTAITPDQLWTVVKGAFALWKHLKGQPPSAVQNHGLNCAVTNNSGQILMVKTDSLNLVFNEKASEPISKFVRDALLNQGYDGLQITSHEGTEIAHVTKDEAPSFVPVGREVVLSDYSARMIVHIVTAVFQDGNKWKFSDGERTFSAAIHDADFLMRVDKGERFGKGDILDVEMRVVQTGDGMRTSVDRAVLHVYHHVAPQEQGNLLG